MKKEQVLTWISIKNVKEVKFSPAKKSEYYEWQEERIITKKRFGIKCGETKYAAGFYDKNDKFHQYGVNTEYYFVKDNILYHFADVTLQFISGDYRNFKFKDNAEAKKVAETIAAANGLYLIEQNI